MKPFIISTDSTADLPEEFVKEHGLYIHPLYYTIEGTQYGGDKQMDMSEFFRLMREGSVATTSATNPEVIVKLFRDQVAHGYDVLHLSFSSGLSCSYNNAVLMANEVMEEVPGSRIVCIDTLCASLGQGLLVYYALKLKEEGKTMDEIITWVKDHLLNICHQFTVEDLKYLYRGGRVSKVSAIVGTMINIKPILHVDDEGHLVPIDKVRGRKRSLTALVDNMSATIGSNKQDIIMISHGDCIEDALFVRDQVKARFGFTNFLINNISPTIGSHSGPGTLALFYIGDKR